MESESDSKNNNIYSVSESDVRAGLKALQPIKGTQNLLVVQFTNNVSIKVDLALTDWASKFVSQCKNMQISEEAISVASRNLHSIESYLLIEKSQETSSEDSTSSRAPTLGTPKASDSEKLIVLIEGMDHEFFLDQHGISYIITKGNDAKTGEPIQLHDNDFTEYAMGLYFDAFEQVLAKPVVDGVATILAYKAKRRINPDTGEPVTKSLFVRVAWKDQVKRDTIYIDLADASRNIVVIRKGERFKVVKQTEIGTVFRRQARLPLPIPERPYNEDIFDEFLDLYRIPREAMSKRLICKANIGMRMIPLVPKPIELMHGEKGGLKSSFGEAEKELIDPSIAISRRIPDNEDDFSLQAFNNYVLFYDNLKHKNIPKYFPDALCRYVYEEATEKRQLYSTMKTVSFGSSGCAIVAGILKAFDEEDVIDRSVQTKWDRLKKGQYLPKRKAVDQFHKLRPKLLAYLFDKAGVAMALYDQVEKELEFETTRMADFTVWGECFSRAFGYKPMDFVKAYQKNLEELNFEIIQASLLGKVIVNYIHYEYQKIIKGRKAAGKAQPIEYNKAIGPKTVVVFKGDIDTLNARLRETVQAAPFNKRELEKVKSWPQSTNKLSQEIRMIQSNLSEAFGIEIEMIQDTTGKLTGYRNRMWVRISKNPDVAPVDMFDVGTGSDGGSGGNSKKPGDPSGPGSLRTRGKVNGALDPVKDSKFGGSNKKLSRGVSLQSLRSLQTELEIDTSAADSGKDRKDCKDSFVKTFLEAGGEIEELSPEDIARKAPTLEQVKSMQKFDNLSKLHQSCKSLVAVDWEYGPDSDVNPDVYLFAYINTEGMQGALHVDDFSSPKEFAEAVNELILRHNYSVAWWSRGVRPGLSLPLSDLMIWHNFCRKVGAESIVELSSKYDTEPTIWSLANPGHRHLDAHSINNQTFIKAGIYKGAIRGMKLEQVYEAAFPTSTMSKLPGVDGSNVHLMPKGVQKAYCLRDSQMVYEIMTKNNGQLLGVMHTISQYIGQDIEYVCHARDMSYLVEPMLRKMNYPGANESYWWEGTYGSGLVQKPIRGRHRNARGIDCVGMYPEIVINYNISSECVCCSCCEYDPKAREQAITGDPEVDGKNY
jgi:hypothetical protein